MELKKYNSFPAPQRGGLVTPCPMAWCYVYEPGRDGAGMAQRQGESMGLFETTPEELYQTAVDEPLDAKIRKNELSQVSRVTITMGLSLAPLVHQFVEHEAMLDSEYAYRLKSGFLSEYHRLRHDGLHGDALFDTMCAFAQRGVRDQAGRSAAVAVLVYLFERCEVFEK